MALPARPRRVSGGSSTDRIVSAGRRSPPPRRGRLAAALIHITSVCGARAAGRRGPQRPRRDRAVGARAEVARSALLRHASRRRGGRGQPRADPARAAAPRADPATRPGQTSAAEFSRSYTEPIVASGCSEGGPGYTA